MTLTSSLAAIIGGCSSSDKPTAPVLQGGEVSAAGSFIDAVGRARGVVRLNITFDSIGDVVSSSKSGSPSVTVKTGPVDMTSSGNDGFMRTVVSVLAGDTLSLTYARATDDRYRVSGVISERQAQGAPISITFVAAYSGRLGAGGLPVIKDLVNLVGTMSISDGNTGPQSNIVSGGASLGVRGVAAMLQEPAG